MADPWRAFSTRLYDQNLFAIKLGLDNMRRAFSLEGHPERCVPAIIVGGTNGKGSTCAMLSSILQAHGLRVGLYTSPHLIEVRERFRVNGAPVSRDLVLGTGRPLLKTYGRPDSDPILTFFELTTLMGAKIFAELKVDVVVWEVGLGGRLDAVNTIEPALTIVTCIDMDHEQYLGTTIEAVAGEKAALFRRGVPAVIGAQDHAEALAVLRDRAPEASVAGVDFEVDEATIQSRHQATAVQAAKTYLGETFDAEKAAYGLAATLWPGRMHFLTTQSVGLEGPWILDAAHNPAGAKQLFGRLAAHKVGAFVVGASKDKDMRRLFAPLASATAPIFGVEMMTKRTASPDMLLEWIPRLKACGSTIEMMKAARRAAGPLPVVVYGSIYLLGECLETLGYESDDLVTYCEPVGQTP